MPTAVRLGGRLGIREQRAHPLTAQWWVGIRTPEEAATEVSSPEVLLWKMMQAARKQTQEPSWLH